MAAVAQPIYSVSGALQEERRRAFRGLRDTRLARLEPLRPDAVISALAASAGPGYDLGTYPSSFTFPSSSTFPRS